MKKKYQMKQVQKDLKNLKGTQEKTNELLSKLVSIEEERKQMDVKKKDLKTWKERREDLERESLYKLEKVIGKKPMEMLAILGVTFLLLFLIIGWVFAFTGLRPMDLSHQKPDSSTIRIEQLEKEIDDIKQDISYQKQIINTQSSLIEVQKEKIAELEKEKNELLEQKKDLPKTNK